MDAVCREIGDRGRPHEAIPPEPAPEPVASAVPAPAPAPAPSLQPEPPPSAALSGVADHEQGFTPSVRSGLTTVAAPEQVGPGSPAATADAGLRAEAPHFAALAGQMLARAEAREARLEALLEARDRELLALRDDMVRQGARAVAAAVTADELADFQARAERLHAAELIGAEELHSCAPRPLSRSDLAWLRPSWPLTRHAMQPAAALSLLTRPDRTAGWRTPSATTSSSAARTAPRGCRPWTGSDAWWPPRRRSAPTRRSRGSCGGSCGGGSRARCFNDQF